MVMTAAQDALLCRVSVLGAVGEYGAELGMGSHAATGFRLGWLSCPAR